MNTIESVDFKIIVIPRHSFLRFLSFVNFHISTKLSKFQWNYVNFPFLSSFFFALVLNNNYHNVLFGKVALFLSFNYWHFFHSRHNQRILKIAKFRWKSEIFWILVHLFSCVFCFARNWCRAQLRLCVIWIEMV